MKIPIASASSPNADIAPAKPASVPLSGVNWNRWIGFALFFGTILLYSRVFNHGYIVYDDEEYVYANPHVLGGLGSYATWWAFTTGYASNWHPLTWLTHQLDITLFGAAHPGAQHAVNVLLHAASTCLLFFVLYRYTGARWKSAIAAALFGWHPMHVESVAWIAERKDVLCALFWMLSLRAYYFYVKTPTRKRFGWVLLFFILGLLSKPMMVTFPFVLLLLDYWPLRRAGFERSDARQWLALWLEKVPLFILTLLASITTFVVQEKAQMNLERLPLNWRIGNSLLAYYEYLQRLFWPARLAIQYPLRYNWSPGRIWLAALVVLAISALALWRLKRSPWFAVGFFWFLGTLVPVIGLVQVGSQAFADRYTYLPSIGLSLAVLWTLDEWLVQKPALRKLAFTGAGIVLAACLTLTFIQTGYWTDTRALFQHDIAAIGENAPAYMAIAKQYSEEKNYDAAMAILRKATTLDASWHKLYRSMGIDYAAIGDYPAAIEYYKDAARHGDVSADLYYNLGNALLNLSNYDGALTNYLRSLEIEPDHPDAYNNLAAVYVRQRRYPEAIQTLESALRVDPQFYSALTEISSIYARSGHPLKAKEFALDAVRQQPKSVAAHTQLGMVYGDEGSLRESLEEFLIALKLDPTNTKTLFYIGAEQQVAGFNNDAATTFGRLLQLDPDDLEAHVHRADALLSVGRDAEAIAEYQSALKLQPDRLGALSGLAWIYSTAPDPKLRDPAEALSLATKAADLSQHKSLTALTALDVAYAANGKFPEAIAAVESTIQAADALKSELASANAHARLKLYQAGQPFRRPVPPASEAH